MFVLYIHFYDLLLIEKLKHKWESILNYESILSCRIVHCMLHCTIFIILLWVSDKLVCLRMMDVCDEKEKAFENLVKNTFVKFLNVDFVFMLVWYIFGKHLCYFQNETSTWFCKIIYSLFNMVPHLRLCIGFSIDNNACIKLCCL